MKPLPTTPALVALCEERRHVQESLEKTMLGQLANQKAAAGRRWVKSGSDKDLKALENIEEVFDRESRNDPEAYRLHLRHIDLQAQIKAHREALGIAKTNIN